MTRRPFYGDSATRVLLAVIAGARTWGDVKAATGLAQGTVSKHMHRLRADGLVTWEPDRAGTVRALVAPSSTLEGTRERQDLQPPAGR